MKALIVPGSLITKKTARGYLKRIARRLQEDLTMEKAIVLDEIEERIVAAGFMDWEEVEAIEIEAMV